MRHVVIAASLLLALAGCATLQQQDRLRDETLNGYAAALRWSGFESAWDYVDPAVRATHPLTPQQKALYATVHVAEYDTQGPVATAPDTIQQTVQLQIIVNATQNVYGVVDHQTWRWDDKARHWWLESGLPDIARRP